MKTELSNINSKDDMSPSEVQWLSQFKKAAEVCGAAASSY